MDFPGVLRRLCSALQREGVEFALIGGLAMAARGAPRATGDVDLLVPSEASDAVQRVMLELGYTARHRTENVANYWAPEPALGGIDFLFARRAYSRAMLARAPVATVLGDLRIHVVQTEDLIGLKVQSSSNDPRRATLDVADIERLLAGAEQLDLARVREYFDLFERGRELEAMLARLGRC